MSMGYDDDDPRGEIVRERLRSRYYSSGWPTDPAKRVKAATARTDWALRAHGGRRTFEIGDTTK